MRVLGCCCLALVATKCCDRWNRKLTFFLPSLYLPFVLTSLDALPHSSFLTYSLGLGKNTATQLSTFRKRSEDARRSLALLKEQRVDVDLAHYKSVLKVSLFAARRALLLWNGVERVERNNIVGT